VNRIPSICRAGVVAIAVSMSLVTGCGDDDGLTLNEAAEVDNDAAAVTGLHGAADVSFGGVTASVSDVTCTNEGRLVVSPIVGATFTLTVDGDPATGAWNIVVTEPGDPAVVWNAVDPTVDLEDDTLAGSAQMRRADDPSVTATLAFVVDC
jgi:hypothetical protein